MWVSLLFVPDMVTVQSPPENAGRRSVCTRVRVRVCVCVHNVRQKVSGEIQTDVGVSSYLHFPPPKLFFF